MSRTTREQSVKLYQTILQAIIEHKRPVARLRMHVATWQHHARLSGLDANSRKVAGVPVVLAYHGDMPLGFIEVEMADT
jgi:hypothetical protein